MNIKKVVSSKGRVLIKLSLDNNTSESGIITKTTENPIRNIGMIVQVNANTSLIKAGRLVIFDYSKSTIIEINNEPHVLIKSKHILGFIN